jgi:hypothetical protein
VLMYFPLGLPFVARFLVTRSRYVGAWLSILHLASLIAGFGAG